MTRQVFKVSAKASFFCTSVTIEERIEGVGVELPVVRDH